VPVLRCGHGSHGCRVLLLCKSRVRARLYHQASALRFGLGERHRDVGGARGVLPYVFRSLQRVFPTPDCVTLCCSTAVRVFPKVLPILYPTFGRGRIKIKVRRSQ
jgi:hypothetical protein